MHFGINNKSYSTEIRRCQRNLPRRRQSSATPRPASSLESVTAFAAFLTSGSAFPMAMPMPADRIISKSFRSSPNAAAPAGSRPSIAQSFRSAVPLLTPCGLSSIFTGEERVTSQSGKSRVPLPRARKVELDLLYGRSAFQHRPAQVGHWIPVRKHHRLQRRGPQKCRHRGIGFFLHIAVSRLVDVTGPVPAFGVAEESFRRFRTESLLQPIGLLRFIPETGPVFRNGVAGSGQTHQDRRNGLAKPARCRNQKPSALSGRFQGRAVPLRKVFLRIQGGAVQIVRDQRNIHELPSPFPMSFRTIPQKKEAAQPQPAPRPESGRNRQKRQQPESCCLPSLHISLYISCPGVFMPVLPPARPAAAAVPSAACRRTSCNVPRSPGSPRARSPCPPSAAPS